MPTTKHERRKTKWAVVAGLLLGWCGLAFGQAAATQPSMPALPKGHPSLEEMNNSTHATAPPLDGSGAMPGALPAGHPPMGNGTGQLPPGHPSLDDLAGATTQPGAGGAAVKMTGTLTVQLVAGTAGEKLAVDEPVTVALIFNNSLVKKYPDLKPDPAGKIVLKDVPVMPPVFAFASVSHAGLTQEAASGQLTPSSPDGEIKLVVYGTTEQAAAWQVPMEHMIVHWSPDGSGAEVTQMVSAGVQGDRIWLGQKHGDTRLTMTFPVAADVENVQVGGNFDPDVTTFTAGKVVTGSVVYPEARDYRLTYHVTAKNGKMELPIIAPAAVGALMVFLPADQAQVTATGLEGGQVVAMGTNKVRMYQAQNLAPGATVSLAISGIPSTADVAAATGGGDSVFTPRNIALAGAFLILLVALGTMLMKKPKVKVQ